MSQTITVKAKGLIKTQNPLGDAPDGALRVADNQVISRDGIIETRRGLSVWATISTAVMIQKLFQYGGRLIAYYSDSTNYKLAYSSADYVTFTEYPGTYAQPSGGTPMRAIEASGNLYLTHADGVKRLDSIAGSPVPAGSPQGLDIEASVVSGAVGTALVGDARFAYRVVWGIKDANENLILGPPSGRNVITTSAVDVAASALSRASSTVTATVVSHGFQIGDKIVLSPGETNFPSGQKTVTAITSTSFQYTESGSATSSTQTHRFKLDVCDATLRITIPPNITSSHFIQIYRSPASESAEIEPTDNLGLIYERNAPATATISTRTRSGTTVTVTTSAAHGFDSGAYIYINPSITDFPAGVKLISVTDSTHFTYSETGTATTSGTTQTAQPLTIVVTDTLPDSLLGAGLYTNPQEEGILNANTVPPAARELSTFKGSIIYANCDIIARLFTTLLAVGPSAGVQFDDTFTLDGLTYTAAATEDYNAGNFQLFVDSTPSLNVAKTVASICRVINRRPDNTTTVAYVIAGPDDEPGRMVFERRLFGTNIVFNPVSHSSAWNPPRNTTETGKTQKNAIYWSKFNQPDSVPLLQFQKLGSSTKQVLRCISTRDAVFIFKEDGIWKLTGEGPDSFRFDVLDTTLELIAPETAVAQDGTAFGLTSQGVVRVTANGVIVVSRGIEVDLLPHITGPLRTNSSNLGFAIPYESDRKYMMWLPSTVSDSICSQAYIYDLFTEAWTHRIDWHRCGILNSLNQRLYVAEANVVWQERKSLNDTDLADRSFQHTIVAISSDGLTLTLDDTVNIIVGDGILQNNNYALVRTVDFNTQTITVDKSGFILGICTRYEGIEGVIEWVAKFGDNPGTLHHFQEATLLFDRIYLADASIKFASNVSSDYETVSIDGVKLQFSSGIVRSPFELRTLVIRNKRRTSQLHVKFTHRQARTPASIQGLILTYESGQTSRVGK